MELRQLRYFAAIVDWGSLSKAANALRVAQPALSQHVRQLEDEFGLALLNRNARGVTPTDAGERLYLRARDLLAQIGDLPQFVIGAVTNPTGEVRIGMSGTVSELVGVPLIELARERYPGVRIRVVEAMSGHVMDWLRRGDIDVGLVYATSDPKGLDITHLLIEDLCLFGRPGGPIQAPTGSVLDFADVLPLKLIIPGPHHGLREIIEDAAAALGLPVEPELEVDSYNHIKRLAASGLGYAILTPTAIMDQVRSGVFDYWKIGPTKLLRRGIYLAHSSERPFSSAASVVSALAQEVVQRLVNDGVWIADLASAAIQPSAA